MGLLMCMGDEFEWWMFLELDVVTVAQSWEYGKIHWTVHSRSAFYGLWIIAQFKKLHMRVHIYLYTSLILSHISFDYFQEAWYLKWEVTLPDSSC